MARDATSTSPLSRLHDTDLALLAASGDRSAFGELARRHGAGVTALLRRLGAQPSLAEDLAQDAFLAAFERIGEYRGEGPFGGWIRRIAARLFLRHWRRRGRLEAPPPDDFDPGDGAEAARQTARRIDLDTALQALTPPERMCVTLCYGAGLTHAEIARAADAPLGTVKSHVKRGLHKLKKRLGADASPDAQPRRGALG